MNLSDINNLDLGNAGKWPAPVKAIAVIALCVGVLGAGYWFDTKEQLAVLEKIEKEEKEKKETFEAKQLKAANLEPLREQLEEMKQSFGAMLRQLPNQAEIDALLVDISQTGLASGLEFELFKPGAETQAEFYAEKPIQIRVKGRYHEFGEFVSGVAALPRIVTQHDIDISPTESELVMEATAKTYRYLEEEQQEKKPAGRKGKKRGKRGR